MGKSIDITGKKFNKLTAIRYDSTAKWGGERWLFRCDCGESKIKSKYDVTRGLIKSCGCLRKKMHQSGSFRKSHGMCGTRFYGIWQKMKARCLYEKHPYYKNYGGRGIVVCSHWHDFVNFKNDMYESYLNHVELHGEKQTTLDRIDNYDGYMLKNCRWASYKKQAKNKRKKS